jgi:electron transport complex protein RnfB
MFERNACRRPALNDALPQTQCTRCGYADCPAYAEAIANDVCTINSARRAGPKARRLAAMDGSRPAV